MHLNSLEIEIIRLPSEARPFLLFIRAGSQPRPVFYDDCPEPRNFDIILNYYQTPNPEDKSFYKADGIIFGGLSKYHAAYKFAKNSQIFEDYAGVMFADDDIEFQFSFDEFFNFCVSEGFDLAQPSLTHDSFSSFSITKNHPGLKYRTTNFVEVMAPFISRKFLPTVLDSFIISISTWGLDVYWGHHLGAQFTAAIVDDFQMCHKKPVSKTGAFYEYLHSIGIDPHVDLRRVFKRLSLQRYNIQPIRFMYKIDTAWSPSEDVDDIDQDQILQNIHEKLVAIHNVQCPP